MINILLEPNRIEAAVMGEFTLADFREFEEKILNAVPSQGTINVLVDLRDMLGFTLDVAWEEMRFSRDHAQDFGRIAIVTDSEWQTWSALLNRLFTRAAIEIFNSIDTAEAWLNGIETGNAG
ncbi:MAG: SpoIIAA family protein [Burkholderiales bacterium]